MKTTLSKEESIAEVRRQIELASARIDELKQRARLAEAGAKTELVKRIGELERLKEDLSDRVDSLKDAADSAWDNLAGGVERSYNELSKAVQKAVDDLKS